LEIDAADVYSGDQGASKVENMRQIQERFGNQQYDFIDDSVKNLRELENSLNEGTQMLRLLLASWGYTGPLDEKTARKYGYPVFTQKDLISLLDQEAIRQNSA
jgi:hypothetical protein